MGVIKVATPLLSHPNSFLEKAMWGYSGEMAGWGVHFRVKSAHCILSLGKFSPDPNYGIITALHSGGDPPDMTRLGG